MKHRKTATLAGAALTAPALAFSLAPPVHAEAAPALSDDTTQSIPKITESTPAPEVCKDYIVKSGDTLSQIAKIHGADLDDVKALNPGVIAGSRPDDYSAIYSGGHIHLPAGHCHPTSSKVPEVFYKGCSVAPAGLQKGDPGYRHYLDMDGDGKACEGPWPPAGTTSHAASSSSTVTGSQESAAADAAIAYAKSKLGSPYVFGATGPSSFDCSGLVYASYVNGAGLAASFPRDTLDELHSLPHISDGSSLPKDILPGDLILMYFTGTSQPDYAVNHVTMYLGDGKQIEATGSHGGVAITNVEGRGGRIVAVVRPTPAKKVVAPAKAAAPASASGTSPAIAPDCPGTASGYCTHDPSFWAPLIEQAMTLVGGNVAANHDVAGVERLMSAESSGNPNAINNYDSNAQNGDPSRGLMQTIGATFNAYHVAGTSTNIYDPLANIAAALAYINDQYGGSIPNSPY